MGISYKKSEKINMINPYLIKEDVHPKIEGYINDFLINLIEEQGPQIVMEIGTLHMKTAQQLLELDCEVHSFDIEKGPPFGWPSDFDIDRISIYIELKKNYPQFHFYPNTNKVYDTYNWSLMKMIQKRTAKKQNLEYFDIIFSDGAHVYLHDALSFFLSDMLLKKGGLMFFDDYNWKLGHPKFTEIENQYTEEQLKTAHVKFIIETVVANHPGYKRLGRETFLKC